MNQSYSYSRPKDPLLGFGDVVRSYRVDHMTDVDCPICNKKLKRKINPHHYLFTKRWLNNRS